jgi:HEAT repeat protein
MLTLATLALVAAFTQTAVAPRPTSPTTAAGPVVMARDVTPARATEPVLQNTPADSLYRAGQAALNRGEYQKSVDTYRELRRRYPRSPRIGDALYWEAFALYRLGGSTNLRVARERLKTQSADFPNASTKVDAGSLRVRVERDLARNGDSEAQAWLDSQRDALPESGTAVAGSSGSGSSNVGVTGSAGASASASAAARDAARASERASRGGRARRDDEAPAGCDQAKYEEQMMAVQALMTMDSERSLPILKKVMARRDTCSAGLRRQAVFILGQHAGDDASIAPLMLDVVKNDPEPEVKKMALFALGQSDDPAAVPALTEILRTSDDRELQRQAIFALGQSDDPRGAATLREYIQRSDVPDELLSHAVMFLGQKGTEETGFLREVYPRLRSGRAKQMVMMTLAQNGSPENAKWLMDRVLDKNEDLEVRKSALFFMGTQSDAVDVRQIAGLYSPTLDMEMRKQVLFVLSQRREPAAVDKLLEIAKNDPDRELRKQAVFWLGQSGDPRAAEMLERMLDQ